MRGCGFNFGNGGCEWILILILILCCCGNGGFGGNSGCDHDC